MGTAQYLSPEQAQGRPVTEASDLYSIGVVLFEMLTGKAPFDGDSAVAVALKHVNQPRALAARVRARAAAGARGGRAEGARQGPGAALRRRGLVHQGPGGGRGAAARRARWTSRARPSSPRSAAATAPTALAPAPPAAAAPPPPPADASRAARRLRRSASRPEEPPDGSRRRWLVAALLGGAGRRWRWSRSCCSGPADKVTVPPVVGQTLEQARAAASIAPASRSRSSAAPTRRRATSCSSSRRTRARRSTRDRSSRCSSRTGPARSGCPDVRRPAARPMRAGGCGVPICGRTSSARARRRWPRAS